MLLVPADRALLFGSFSQWGPVVIAIAMSLLVAAVIRSARVPLPAVMTIGLAFEVAETPPAPPASRTDLPIPAALDDLVLSCPAKDPANRPQSARELSLRLAEVDGAAAWTQDRARDWWASHQPVFTS